MFLGSGRRNSLIVIEFFGLQLVARPDTYTILQEIPCFRQTVGEKWKHANCRTGVLSAFLTGLFASSAIIHLVAFSFAGK